MAEKPDYQTWIDGQWKTYGYAGDAEAVRAEYQRVHGRDPADTDIGHGLYRWWFGDYRLHEIWDTGGGGGGKNGMDHPLEGGTGRMLYGPRDRWYFPSTYMWLEVAEITEFFRDADMRGMTHMWVNLSAGRRDKMNERTFNFLENQTKTDAVLRRLDHIIGLGIQPIVEIGTQEFFIQELAKSPVPVADYVTRAAAFLSGRCKLAFVTREWGDRGLYHTSDPKERVQIFNKWNRALDEGLAPGVSIGVHTRSGEMPPVGLYSGIRREKWWLAHWKFTWNVTHAIELDGEIHDFGGAWLDWAIKNRQRKIAGIKVGMFEHSIKVPGWGATQTLSEATTRGDHFLEHARDCAADWSGGARRRVHG